GGAGGPAAPPLVTPASPSPAHGGGGGGWGRAWRAPPDALAPQLLFLPAAVAAHARFLDAQVELLDVFLFQQSPAAIFHHHAADLKHVAVIGEAERHARILLDEEDRRPFLAIDPHDDAEDLSDQDRREAQRRLV